MTHHVVPIDSALAWTDLAALLESYATAWIALHDNLACRPGDTLVVRGGPRHSVRRRSIWRAAWTFGS